MNFPLSFDEISLWLAISAMILWLTLETLLVRYEKRTYRIERKKLKKITLAISFLFIVTVGLKAISILIFN